MVDEMKLCPFCGSIAALAPNKKEVACLGCEALGPFCDTEKEAIEAWNARAELGSDDRHGEIYDAGFSNGIQAVFQQLECIEDYEGLQDLIAEYWGEGEGHDEP